MSYVNIISGKHWFRLRYQIIAGNNDNAFSVVTQEKNFSEIWIKFMIL